MHNAYVLVCIVTIFPFKETRCSTTSSRKKKCAVINMHEHTSRIARWNGQFINHCARFLIWGPFSVLLDRG